MRKNNNPRVRRAAPRDAQPGAQPGAQPDAQPDTPQDTEEYVMMAPTYPADDRFSLEECSEPAECRVPAGRPVRIYCDGVYDLFHYGHARQLMQAKHLFPAVHLIVGVHSTEETLRNKGTAVMTEEERYESVRHCRYVDEVLEDAPWVITAGFLAAHAIDFVAHDAALYQSQDHEDIYAEAKALGKFVPTKRTVAISTTGIITRIVRDYDVYVRRQLSRGISGQELNISSAHERRLRAGRGLGPRIRGIKSQLYYVLGQWEAMSQTWLHRFLGGFERPRGTGWVTRVLNFVGRKREVEMT